VDFHPSQPITFEPFSDEFLTFDPRKVYQQLCTVNKLAFPSRKRKEKKHLQTGTNTGEYKPPSSRQRALIAAAHLTGQDVSSTSSVYKARNNPELPIVIDSGASVSVTPHIRDYRGPLQKCPTKSLDGLSSKTEVLGMGKVTWEVQDFYDVKRTITTMVYYVLTANIRLFSPKVYFDEQHGGSYHMENGMIRLTFGDGTPLTFPYQPGRKLQMMLTSSHFNNPTTKIGLTFEDTNMLANLTVADEVNQNLTAAKKELLLWHWKLVHADMQRVQMMIRNPQDTSPHEQILLPKVKTASSCEHPLCAACHFAKPTRRNPGPIQGIDSSNLDLSQGEIQPGTKVSIYQYISGLPGRLTHTRGKEDKKTQYNGRTIFVDHCSGYIHHKNQVSLRIGETLKGKHNYECFAKKINVKIKHYHADNAPFGGNEFKADIANQDLDLTFSGVGANHQNGVAERSIWTVTQWARAMLLHSSLHWPEVADLKLWPFALDHAIFLWNNMPHRDTRLAPIEVFTSTKFQNYKHLERCHVWDGPVFVLDPALQDGKKIPKWNPRSRLGMYLGNSPVHSSTIARVLNLRTGYITAQYHAVHDDLFSTVHDDGTALAWSFDPRILERPSSHRLRR
jgi:hypothetical protein